LALSAIASVGLLFAGTVGGLSAISIWAERDLHAYPFKSEDWLRYLLPARLEALDREKIMLIGPSTVRENFRYDLFEAAFPNHDIYQGGISLGTIEDVTVALEYVKKVYGKNALPTIVVLGTSPRFVANIPDDRPFALGLNRYSPHYSTVQEPTRIALVEKGFLASILARGRFHAAKYPKRYRTGLLAVLNHLLTNDTSGTNEEPALARAFDRLLWGPLIAPAIRKWSYEHVHETGYLEYFQWAISPYKYSLEPRRQFRMVTREEYEPDLDSWWPQVYYWVPRKDEAKTRARLKHFADFLKRNDIRALVVNMPERDVSRILFDEVDYRAYLDLVRGELADFCFENLREFIDTVEFHDKEHTTTAGSIRLTNEVIRLMQARIFQPIPGC
jgi:hypothetical protein